MVKRKNGVFRAKYFYQRREMKLSEKRVFFRAPHDRKWEL
jgi:hypothetical protein